MMVESCEHRFLLSLFFPFSAPTSKSHDRWGPLVDSGVSVRGWGCVILHRVAPIALPRGSRIGSVMGRLQPVACRTAIRRLIHTLAHGNHPSFGVSNKPWVVLAVGNHLVVAGFETSW